ncbi:hypothetical protein SLEP1_g20241 [Rubroshorea leprosula]|uniref:Uncharacterized protein n=1 Tax=Rubroshorea leprosula TaxID=152421 RepID=A0AAV5J5B7_9ROSI|nr:hypothetical protein SLEP1_g20241 [Rubroshorea leprosula]
MIMKRLPMNLKERNSGGILVSLFQISSSLFLSILLQMRSGITSLLFTNNTGISS